MVVIVLVVSGLGNCSSSNNGANSAAANFLDENVSAGIAAQTPPPPQPLSAVGVSRGMAHLRLAAAAEGFAGAMVYSQNCYDALGHQFTWAKLDTCGAFDMLAVRSMANADTSALTSEIAYFQSETAAGRYLAAATGAGEPAAEADGRLSQLQARAARARTAGPRPTPVAEPASTAAPPRT